MPSIARTKFSCSRGNLTLRGTEYRPNGDQLPIAIVCHGFMANQGTVKHYARFFAEEGYAAYTFDFSGGCVIFGKSDGKTTDMSVLTEVEDLCAVIDHVCSLPYTNEENITLMGCSQGGFVSALTAAKLKERIQKLVLFYPAFCIPDDARRGKMMWAKFDPKIPPATFRCGPMKLGRQYITDVVHMDPFKEIRPYPGDVLIIHGTHDKIVPSLYSQRACIAYKKRHIGNVALHLIEKGAHGFSKKHDAIAFDHLKSNLYSHFSQLIPSS